MDEWNEEEVRISEEFKEGESDEVFSSLAMPL